MNTGKNGLSRRLQAVADLVSPGKRVCDVGCDHGYVSIYLIESGRADAVLAMDVNRGPLERARINVEKHGLTGYITLRLSNGLDAYRTGEAQSLVIAGMGGRLMQSILTKDKEKTEDFEELILKYSDSEEGTCSFGKGEKDQAFEDAAFNLETDEISDIVETPDGYYLIKCISTFNRTETDANKVKIVEKRREEVFGQEYEDFVAALTRNLNEDLWQSVSLAGTENITTSDFFDVFNKFFDGIL